MRRAVIWLIALALVLFVIGLVAYARGPEHHRGDDVGALGKGVVPTSRSPSSSSSSTGAPDQADLPLRPRRHRDLE